MSSSDEGGCSGCLGTLLALSIGVALFKAVTNVFQWAAKSFFNSSLLALSILLIVYGFAKIREWRRKGVMKIKYLRLLSTLKRYYNIEIQEYDRRRVTESIKPVIKDKRYILLGITSAVILMSPILIDSSDEEKHNTNEEEKRYEGRLPENIDNVRASHISGAWSSRYDTASDYWVNYNLRLATWNDLEEMDVRVPGWAEQHMDDYQGIIYWREKGNTYKVQSRNYEEITEEKYAWGVWEMGEKFRSEEDGNSGIEIKARWNKKTSKGFSRDDDIVTLWVYEYPDSGHLTLAWDTGLNADTFGAESTPENFWKSNLN